MVGYSNAPLPAFFSWVTAMGIVTGVRINGWFAEEPASSWTRAMGDAFSMPFQILRLGNGADVFNNRLASTLALLLTALPLIFLLIAIKNVMREPASRN